MDTEGWWESTSACIANRRCNLVIDFSWFFSFRPPTPHDPGVLKTTLPLQLSSFSRHHPTSRHPILRAQKNHPLTFFSGGAILYFCSFSAFSSPFFPPFILLLSASFFFLLFYFFLFFFLLSFAFLKQDISSSVSFFFSFLSLLLLSAQSIIYI